jgi:gliding motility-associated-like protein
LRSNGRNQIPYLSLVEFYSEYGSFEVSITFPNSGFYGVDLTVTSVFGCVYTNTIENIVQALPLPIANFTFSSNPATFFETSIMLQNSSTSDVVNWEWFSPGSVPSYSLQENPMVNFPEGVVGTYPVTLIVTTGAGCMDTVNYLMNIIPAILFYAPNSFTPDDDEFNQQWEFFVSGIDIYNFNLTIYNRWGETIWETKDPSAKWDGTFGGERIQTGTYVWKASVKDPYSDFKKEFTGHINVLR